VRPKAAYELADTDDDQDDADDTDDAVAISHAVAPNWGGRRRPPDRQAEARASRSKRKADKGEFRFGTAASDGPEDSKKPKRSRQRLSAWRPIC